MPERRSDDSETREEEKTNEHIRKGGENPKHKTDDEPPTPERKKRDE